MSQLRESSLGASVLAILLLAFLIDRASGDYDRSLDNGNGLCMGSNCADRPGNGISGAMWFGPRLGRRRRSDGQSIDVDNEEMNVIADAINGGPWTFVPHRGLGDKRHTTQFTPRLGRELGDDFLQRFIGVDQGDGLSRMVESQASDMDIYRQLSLPSSPPPFAPRLGRHLLFIPSPRLGRRLRTSAPGNF